MENTGNPLFLGRRVVQNCWVVPSIEKAVDHWVKAFGVGAWLLLENDPDIPRYYHGKETDCRYRAALADWGNIQVELVDSLRDGPSPFADVYRPGETSFHHVAIETDDFEADVARFGKLGFPLAFRSTYGDMQYGMVDTRPGLGFMIELLENSEMHTVSVNHVRELARDFDGTNPLRRP